MQGRRTQGEGAIGPQDLGKYATDFLKDGRRIGQFGETRITTGWLLSDRNSI